MASSHGVWRDPVHPRFTDRRPALDWAACAALAAGGDAPWSQVRLVLLTIEAGARAAVGDLETDADTEGEGE